MFLELFGPFRVELFFVLEKVEFYSVVNLRLVIRFGSLFVQTFVDDDDDVKTCS